MHFQTFYKRKHCETMAGFKLMTFRTHYYLMHYTVRLQDCAGKI